MTTREYMQCVTAVEPQWLAEVGPMFYAIKDSIKTGREMLMEQRRTAISMEEEMKEAQRIIAERKEQSERSIAITPNPISHVGQRSNKSVRRRFGI